MIYPKQIIIEVTSRCNLKCKGCYRDLGKVPNTDMDIGTFRFILEQLTWKPEVVPFNDGEAFMHPDFHQMLRMISNRKLPQNYGTNGTIWRQDIIDETFSEGSTVHQVCVSLDGGTDRTIAALRPPLKGYEAHYFFRKFLAEKKRRNSNLQLGVSLVRMGQSWEEIESFVVDYLAEGADFVILRNWLPSDPQTSPTFKTNCHWLDGWYTIVSSDGEVKLCGRYMNLPKGISVWDKPLLDIYNQDFDCYRRYFPQEPCRTCPQPFSGKGFFGEVTFRIRPQERIFLRQDYFNQIFSKTDNREGVSWQQ